MGETSFARMLSRKLCAIGNMKRCSKAKLPTSTTKQQSNNKAKVNLPAKPCADGVVVIAKHYSQRSRVRSPSAARKGMNTLVCSCGSFVELSSAFRSLSGDNLALASHLLMGQSHKSSCNQLSGSSWGRKVCGANRKVAK